MEGRSKRSGAYKRSKVKDLLTTLKHIPKKSDTKDDLSVVELIEKVWPGVMTMRSKGYTYTDIATYLLEHGVQASVETMKSALGDVASRKRSRVRVTDDVTKHQTKQKTMQKTEKKRTIEKPIVGTNTHPILGDEEV